MEFIIEVYCGEPWVQFSHSNVRYSSVFINFQEYACKEKSVDDESRKYSDKLRDVCALAERLGCTFGQLAIAWSLKNESVQCLLLGASNIDQLYESLQSLQVRMYRWDEKLIYFCDFPKQIVL